MQKKQQNARRWARELQKEIFQKNRNKTRGISNTRRRIKVRKIDFSLNKLSLKSVINSKLREYVKANYFIDKRKRKIEKWKNKFAR